MKLISMTDFVLEQKKTICKIDSKDTDYYFNNIVNYANFLKQPLKLEMFVPTDKYGNVLEEKLVENYENDFGLYSDFRRYNKEYNEAKKKVLFETNYELHVIKDILTSAKIIEDLVTCSKLNITLTPNVIKQLGL